MLMKLEYKFNIFNLLKIYIKNILKNFKKF